MSVETDFNQFWKFYPRKVGRLAAKREYEKARKLTEADVILKGLTRYLGHLPRDLEFVPHARKWLHDGRWEDEYTESRRTVDATMVSWLHDCKRLHNSECGLRKDVHDARCAREAAGKGA